MKGKVNDYLKGFKFPSIAEQQKQMRARYDLAAMNSAFFGQAIDVDNQTTANWRSLPLVYDLVNASCPLAYKASALGIFTLLVDCNRVIDMQGNRLNLDDIFSRIYLLRRFREATGDRVPVIDSMTDRYTAGYIFETMTKYYTAKYGVNITKFFQAGQKISTTTGCSSPTTSTMSRRPAASGRCSWTTTSTISSTPSTRSGSAGMPAPGRTTCGSSTGRTSPRASPARRRRTTSRRGTTPTSGQCVITPNVRKYELRSETWTVMVDRPERHLIIHNFKSGCPRVTIPGCTVPQS